MDRKCFEIGIIFVELRLKRKSSEIFYKSEKIISVVVREWKNFDYLVGWVIAIESDHSRIHITFFSLENLFDQNSEIFSSNFILKESKLRHRRIRRIRYYQGYNSF